MPPPYPTALPTSITTPPPPLVHTLISFPTPQILLVTINRPRQMNCINTAGHHEMHALFEWYDAEPSLRCAVVTGAGGGKKDAFCAGQDLKEWHASVSTPTSPTAASGPSHPPSGFAGLSQRTGKKPVIAAVHGLAFGGGLEVLLNTDLSLCTPTSTFSLPESSIGVAAFAGALPRLALLVGLPRASELAYTGRVLTGAEAAAWGIVNRVVPGGHEEVVDAAVGMAGSVCAMSPDSVVVSRLGLRSAWEAGGVAEKVGAVWEGVGARLREGENVKEGLRSFVEGRRPRWKDSKL